MIDVHDRHQLDRRCRELRIDPHRLKRMRVQFYKNGRETQRALEELPEGLREELVNGVRFRFLELEQAHDSQIDGATKLVFTTDDQLRFETVILRVKSGRTALCVSSQVGCAAACRFCATGQLGIRRNLTTSEILDQIVQANLRLRSEDQRVRNLVFMGMGEPFHNEEAVFGALDVLTDTECFHHAPARISVSTVGIPDGMIRLARRFPKVRIALSLHSARQSVREELIPLARRFPLDQLAAAVATTTEIQGQPVMLEYLLLEGRNDGAADLEALDEWARPLGAHINLIPYNPIPGTPDLRPTNRSDRENFANELKERGHKVTLRYSLGADITAACGQLVREENRRA